MRKVVRIDKPGLKKYIINFDKVGKELEWLGIVDARERGNYELEVVADHRVVRTRGRVIVRAVVGAGSKIKIKGVIRIAKEAQQSDAYLELRVLTLDKTALATADPELEILANSVMAGHAASVGGLDLEQQSYLMSRGLTKVEAEEEIVRGWLGV